MPNTCVLWGHILEEREGRILLDVIPAMGDAPIFGLAGQIWFARRECRKVEEHTEKPTGARGLDFVSIPPHVAKAKAANRYRK